MKNFEFLFTAWMVVWAVFFVYEVTVARRITQVREEIERLKQMFDAAKQGYNEQAGKLLHRLLTGREVVFLGDETVTIQGTAGPVDPSTIS